MCSHDPNLLDWGTQADAETDACCDQPVSLPALPQIAMRQREQACTGSCDAVTAACSKPQSQSEIHLRSSWMQHGSRG